MFVRMSPMTEPRYCSNCRAELFADANTCAACGVFAGDVFDGRKPHKARKPSGLLFGLLVIAILGGAGYWYFVNSDRAKTRADAEAPLPSARVVKDRPGGSRRATGATINEAEAIRLLRRHLVATRNIRNECVAVLSRGPSRGDYTFSVADSCEGVRLGTWRVDGKTKEVAGAGERTGPGNDK
jgi:hypothetical protein